jgi:hypothetical protein
MTSNEPIFRSFEIHGLFRRMTLGKKAWTTEMPSGRYTLFRAQSGEWHILWSPAEGAGPDQLVTTFGANSEPEGVLRGQRFVEAHNEAVRAEMGIGKKQTVPVVRGGRRVRRLVEPRQGMSGATSASTHCYRCAEEGHIREMQLVTHVMIDMRKWDKPWSPTQGCLQCGNCGRLTCWTHSDNQKPCECEMTLWTERTYLQKELDNG